MQPAVFIARLVGPAFVAVGLGILLNGPFYTSLLAEATRSPTLIYFSGLISLIPGLAILNVHRTWTSDWRVIITILGWLLVIGGVIRIVLPATTAPRSTSATDGSIHYRAPSSSFSASCSATLAMSRSTREEFQGANK